jgi:hypothetical protein
MKRKAMPTAGIRYADDYSSSPIGPCNASYSAMAAFHSSSSACVQRSAFSAAIIMRSCGRRRSDDRVFPLLP